jgi:fermentation-respiration switch protein FrsA (DUF1100 family)
LTRYKGLKAAVLVAALAISGAIVCMAALSASFCAQTLRVARWTAADPPDSTIVEVFAPDHVKLSGWWLRAAEGNGNCVLVVHGIGDARAGSIRFASMFLKAGYSVLAPDSRAHGASGGEFVTYGLLEKFDALAWARWMKGEGCRKIYGLGESLGASVLIQAAGLDPAFSAIAVECPFADLREVGEYRLGVPVLAKLVVGGGMLYARWFYRLDFREVAPLRAIQQTSTPVLLIHGLSDVKTPPSQSEKLAAANPRSALWLVPNAGHVGAYTEEPAEFERRVLEWFGKH